MNIRLLHQLAVCLKYFVQDERSYTRNTKTQKDVASADESMKLINLEFNLIRRNESDIDIVIHKGEKVEKHNLLKLLHPLNE